MCFEENDFVLNLKGNGQLSRESKPDIISKSIKPKKKIIKLYYTKKASESELMKPVTTMFDFLSAIWCV